MNHNLKLEADFELMNHYRKSDQDYYDDYDRATIAYLKEIEKLEKLEYPKTEIIDGKKAVIKFPIIGGFRNEAILRARDREHSVRALMHEDERRDRLVKEHNTPENIRCEVCNTRMALSGHTFDFEAYKILFLFDCPKQQHQARKIIHPDGETVYFPKPKCRECGEELITTTKKTKLKFTITEKCSSCKYEDSYTINRAQHKPITNEDRQKYCAKFIGQRTELEELKMLATLKRDLDKSISEKLEAENYAVDKTEILTLPKLKTRLTDLVKEANFIEFALDKPEIKRHIVIGFSVQDASERNKDESQKILSKLLHKNLLLTNWRLLGEVTYTLGYLAGKLKGFEDPQDLLSLAKEIKNKSAKKSK